MTTSAAPGYLAGMQTDDGSLDAVGLIAVYRNGIDSLSRAAAGLTREQAVARPVPGKWSALELVAHLADCELVFGERILRTLAMDKPLHLGMDETHYAARLGYQSLDLDEELAVFAAVRRRVARVLANLPPEAWQRPAVHADSGLVTVRQLVFQTVRHLAHHLPFLAEKRAALEFHHGDAENTEKA